MTGRCCRRLAVARVPVNRPRVAAFHAFDGSDFGQHLLRRLSFFIPSRCYADIVLDQQPKGRWCLPGVKISRRTVRLKAMAVEGKRACRARAERGEMDAASRPGWATSHVTPRSSDAGPV